MGTLNWAPKMPRHTSPSDGSKPDHCGNSSLAFYVKTWKFTQITGNKPITRNHKTVLNKNDIYKKKITNKFLWNTQDRDNTEKKIVQTKL